MANYRRDEIWTGLFVLAACAVFLAFAFKVGGFGSLAGLGSAPGRSFTIELLDAKGLGPGSRVAVGGIGVGAVAEVRLVPGGSMPGRRASQGQVAEVTFEISDPDLPIDPSTASAALLQDGVLGPFYLDLDTGEPRLATVDPARTGRIAAREVADATDVVSAAQEAVATVQAVAKSLEETAPVLRALLRNVTDLTDPTNANSLQRQIVEPGAGALRKADLLLEELRRALDPTTLARIAALAGEAESLLVRARGSLDQVDGALGSVRTVVDENRAGLARAVAGAESATGKVQASLAAIEADAHVLLSTAHEVVAENRAEVAEILRRLRRSAWQAELALRQIRGDPASLLWGTEVESFETEDGTGLGERAAAGGFGRAPLYEQRAEREPPR